MFSKLWHCVSKLSYAKIYVSVWLLNNPGTNLTKIFMRKLNRNIHIISTANDKMTLMYLKAKARPCGDNFYESLYKAIFNVLLMQTLDGKGFSWVTVETPFWSVLQCLKIMKLQSNKSHIPFILMWRKSTTPLHCRAPRPPLLSLL